MDIWKGEILMHCGYVVKVEKLRPHGNADRLQIATFFGNDTCVGLDVKIGDKRIYFPTDLQLSAEYCAENHLCRKKADGSPDTGYMDPDKRNVTAVRLRGERSDGLYMPLSSLEFTGVNIEELGVGDTIDIVNGVEICRKYIPRGNKRVGRPNDGNRTRKKKAPVAPLFSEHADTEQLAYNLSAFRPGDQIEITLKMHGTSQRTGYLPTLKGYKKNILDYILRREGTPIYDWGYVTGTRRTVLENYEGGYYGDNAFRETHSKVFEGKLHKGETVYYEVVGFTNTGTPIMGSSSNAKLNDKEFIKQYGDTTVFSYGCSPTDEKTMYGQDEDGIFSIKQDTPQSDMYVYRMTITNEDGDVVEYTPDFMRYRCEQMGIKTVPVMWSGFIPEHPGSKADPTITAGEWIKNVAEMYYDGPDPVGKTHVREGVVVRVLNRPGFCAFKHKNFEFKCLEGIVKADAETPDIEEAQEITENIEE
jgi:hypothetical protein